MPMAKCTIAPLALWFSQQADHLGMGSTFKPFAMHKIGDHSATCVVPRVGGLPTLSIERTGYCLGVRPTSHAADWHERHGYEQDEHHRAPKFT